MAESAHDAHADVLVSRGGRMTTIGPNHPTQRAMRRVALCLMIAVGSPTGAQGATTQPSTNAGDWPMAARDYASTRFSPLQEISPTNVASLKLAYTFSTGVVRGHEAAPIVVGGTMFIVTPYPNVVYALDLSRPGAPLRWRFEPKPEAFAQGVACCDVVNRGLAYADGKVFLNTLDNQTIALDASSGKELWRYRSGDIRAGETRTMAPLVVNGRVLIGNSGGEYGVRGWLVALDAQKGKEVWRAYSTGPDRDVLIGPGYKPFYAKDRGADLGVKTWPTDAWKIGGGTVWGWISYDAELDLVYYGTANPGPWNAEQRPGDNKFTSGLFARDASTGQARWFYQLSPHDEFDYDAVNESVLVDLVIDGKPRKVLVHPDRNGYVYVMDRSTGEVLSATPFVSVNTSTGIDLETGSLQYASAKAAANRNRGARNLPRLPGRQGLAALRVFAAHAAALHTAPESLPGPGGHANELHRRNAVCWVDYQDQARARRSSRACNGVGSGRREIAVGYQGGPAGVERRARHRGRRGVLRHDGWLVQGGGRQGRPPALAVQDRLRNRRPADLLSRPGRQTIHRSALRRRWVGRGGRIRRSRYTRWKRRRRNGQPDGRSEATHDQGRHAVCLRASLRVYG